MPRDKDFKRRVRRRIGLTVERYTLGVSLHGGGTVRIANARLEGRELGFDA